MHVLFSALEPLDLHAYSVAPHRDHAGFGHDASIKVEFIGESGSTDPNRLRLSLTPDEAEAIAAELIRLVADVRAGKYSDEGRESLESSKKTNLDRV